MLKKKFPALLSPAVLARDGADLQRILLGSGTRAHKISASRAAERKRLA